MLDPLHALTLTIVLWSALILLIAARSRGRRRHASSSTSQ